MIDCKEFYDSFKEKGIEFFAGVPDSLLKDFNAYVMDHTDSDKHCITHNEGGAVALATGYHLATNKIPLVYMQNSGVGNVINPLTSLTDKEVYSIPMILLIGWRGEGEDEPQHIKMGKVTSGLLNTIGIDLAFLPSDINKAKKVIDKAVNKARETNSPYGIVVRKESFEPYKLQNKIETKYELNREGALKLVVDQLNSSDVIISTTGKTSRELFEYREELNQGHQNDFLTVGSMGHSSMIALGISLQKPNRTVYCFDGDGAALMHLGGMGIIGSAKPKNLKHIIFNNGAHDSVGGQPTIGFNVDFPLVAQGLGYNQAWTAESSIDIKEKFKMFQDSEGPSLLEIRVNKGSRKDLGRPTTSTLDNKKSLMEEIK